MKTVIENNPLAASDIVTSGVYPEYSKLLELDIARLGSGDLRSCSCPGCEQDGHDAAFLSMGLRYVRCAHCGSLYVSPRPTPDALDALYRDGSAARYWRNHVLNLSEDELQKLHRSRLDWIEDSLIAVGPKLKVLDLESKYPFILAGMGKMFDGIEISTWRPRLFESCDLLEAYAPFDESAQGTVDVVTAFDTLERMENPRTLFELAARACRKGGVLLLTTATATGFEYQLLGEKAPNLNPINRMNLLSIGALRAQAEKAGFRIMELSTPGRLDVEVVKQALARFPDLPQDSLWRYILTSGEPELLQQLQLFLQAGRLSSHVRLAAQRI